MATYRLVVGFEDGSGQGSRQELKIDAANDADASEFATDWMEQQIVMSAGRITDVSLTSEVAVAIPATNPAQADGQSNAEFKAMFVSTSTPEANSGLTTTMRVTVPAADVAIFNSGADTVTDAVQNAVTALLVGYTTVGSASVDVIAANGQNLASVRRGKKVFSARR